MPSAARSLQFSALSYPAISGIGIEPRNGGGSHETDERHHVIFSDLRSNIPMQVSLQRNQPINITVEIRFYDLLRSRMKSQSRPE
jgi:hypothetical protein